MAPEVNTQTVNDDIQSIVDDTANPNFCKEFHGISANYEDNA